MCGKARFRQRIFARGDLRRLRADPMPAGCGRAAHRELKTAGVAEFFRVCSADCGRPVGRMIARMPGSHTLNIAVIGPDRRCARALAGLAATLPEGRAQTFTSANDAIAYCSEQPADLVLLGHP